MAKLLSVILGGGKGTRLYPLTKERAKPAVPFGAKYRLVDIPISNCINSNFRNIYVLTQFNTASLHLHILSTYQFDSFSGGFVEILAAEQTFQTNSWYMGTADAVRKNFNHFKNQHPTHYIILSGDQLYRMDLKHFFQTHLDSGAEVTIASTPVTRQDADQLGILQIDKKCRIQEFLEKPGPDKDISDYIIPETIQKEQNFQDPNKQYLASMGIYIFSADAMKKGLETDYTDFGKEIIPEVIKSSQVNAYVYNGYWEDIGTIKNFYESNIDLAQVSPRFNLYDEENPIYSHKRDLPPSKINACNFVNSLSAEGAIITNANVNHSLVGIRTIIRDGASLDGVYCMGADNYETDKEKSINREKGIPCIGIGQGSYIKGAIIDKNARIGSGCRIGLDPGKLIDGEYDNYYIRDGIIVIPKGAVLPDNMVI